MVSALPRAGDKLIVPDGLELKRVSEEAFEEMLKKEAGKQYDNYGDIA